MKIIVKAKPNSSQEKVELLTPQELDLPFTGTIRKPQHPTYRVWVKEAPQGGKANTAISKALAKYFKIPQSLVELVHGQSGKQKIFEINN